jgi:RTX calcium-binding nonapeptide repeat (4 copies)
MWRPAQDVRSDALPRVVRRHRMSVSRMGRSPCQSSSASLPDRDHVADWIIGATPSVGSGSPCTIRGTSTGDALSGTPARDVICGLDGSDTSLGKGGDDRLPGRHGHDRILGGRDNDRVVGGPGDDTIIGDERHDVLYGARGRDLLRGGRQGDILDGRDSALADEGDELISVERLVHSVRICRGG